MKGRVSRFIEIGKHITFKRMFLEQVLSGKKRSTIRLGIVRPRFSEVYIACENYVYAIAEIERVEYLKVHELDEDIVKSEGFRCREELLKALKRIYSKLDTTDYVTLIWFKVKKIFDKPKRLDKIIEKS